MPRRAATFEIEGSTSLLKKTKDLSRRQQEREKQSSPTSASVMNNLNMPELMEQLTFTQSLKPGGLGSNGTRQIPELHQFQAKRVNSTHH